jgi:hypothetical protein
MKKISLVLFHTRFTFFQIRKQSMVYKNQLENVGQLNFKNQMTSLIVSIDLGTTSTRSLVFDEKLEVVSTSQQEYTQFHENPGWTDQNPQEGEDKFSFE